MFIDILHEIYERFTILNLVLLEGCQKPYSTINFIVNMIILLYVLTSD